MPDLKINKIYAVFDGKYWSFSTQIPKHIVPKEFEEKFIESMEKYQERRNELKAEGLSKSEIRDRLESFKDEEGIKNLYAVFTSLGNNISAVNFLLDEDRKTKYLGDEAKKELMEQQLNHLTSTLRQKDIVVMPMKKAGISSEETEALEEEIEGLKKQVEFYRNIVIQYFRLMIFAGVNEKEYQNNKSFKTYIKWSPEQEREIKALMNKDIANIEEMLEGR